MENIALHLLDIIQNSIEAQSSHIAVEIEKDSITRQLRITVTDNGKGMSEQTINNALDPFYTSRTTRKVGMGLPLLKQQAEQTGGFLLITSELNKGTTVSFCFHLAHIDCPPIGDLADIMSTLFVVNPEINFSLCVRNGVFSFSCESKQILGIFKDLPLSQKELRQYIFQFLSENMNWLIHQNVPQ
jgi:hypothetical protein